VTEPNAPKVSGVPVQVVLVDDAEDVRRLVRTALRFRGGFEVVGEAGSGAEAVELAQRLRPDLVVLDLGLPDIAGEDVLTRIRADSPRTNVVIFSGRDVRDRAWFEERVAGYVLKDADLDFLVDLLEKVGRRDGEMTLELPRDLASVGRAREFVAGAFENWGVAGLTDDALIVVSELVTNAVTHARSGCEVRLAVDDTAVRIAVADRGAGTPDPKPFSASQPHGRGLHIVGALSSAWGVDDLPDGKVVWAEMSRTAS
jgi:CheY-like chemotaxis protein/anti-sigma regulatory factor (Ser/Thr protein kinase)